MNFLQKRGFSSLYKYSQAGNPKAFLTIASGENKVGDLVFELYEDKQAAAVDNFVASLQGGYVGTKIEKGMAGLGITAGATNEEGLGAEGTYNPDGDMSLRHHKRGMISFVSQGEHLSGSEFMVTFGAAPFLDGYQTVFGELVDGETVLAELESATDRQGHVHKEFTIVGGGML